MQRKTEEEDRKQNRESRTQEKIETEKNRI